MADRATLVRRLRTALGDEHVLDDAAARLVYARDASHLSLGRPLCVCLPADTAQVAETIGLCAEANVPFVARGAGSGLAGGALPPEGAVVVSLARLTGITESPTGRADEILAGAGVPNAALNRHLARTGRAFAPDPGSQEVSTIGGNIACNAGGPHCLKVGTTVQHVRELQWVDASGAVWSSGRVGDGAPDITSLLVGGEGTLGVVTAAILRTVPVEPGTATLLAYFDALDAATASVVDLLGAGLLPAAVELVDGEMLRIVEDAFAFGFRTDVDAAMIVEFTGDAGAVQDDAERAATLLAAAGAEVVQARGERERLDLWRCRKQAFGAVGRLSPHYVSMDVAVPLAHLPELARRAREAGQAHEVRVANLMHAGDGNMHPGVLFDGDRPGERDRANAAANEIIAAALDLGGTVTGEHGVGIEKLHVVAAQLDPVAAGLMGGIKGVFDPRGIANPGKAIAAAPGKAKPPPVLTAPLFDWDSLAVTAPADVALPTLQAEAARRGFRLDCDGDASLRELADRGALRDGLLEVWAETRDGRLFHAGRPVAKNVAGYDLARLVCGCGGALGSVKAVTLPLKPVGWTITPGPVPAPTSWPAPESHRRALIDLFAGEGDA
jgi:glycolate oxidase